MGDQCMGFCHTSLLEAKKYILDHLGEFDVYPYVYP